MKTAFSIAMLVLVAGLAVTAMAPTASAACDATQPRCLVDWATWNEECINNPVPGDRVDYICWA